MTLVACAGDDGEVVLPETARSAKAATSTDPATTTEPSAQGGSLSAPIFGKPILVETRIIDARRHVGVVVRTSVIGESAFCPGGRTSGGSEGAAITTTFRCRGGTLTVRYSPVQRSRVQGSAWEVISGTGNLAGLSGGGSMVAIFEKEDPDRGREIFAGLVGE